MGSSQSGDIQLILPFSISLLAVAVIRLTGVECCVQMHSGVRAVPRRTPEGTPPLVGRFPSPEHNAQGNRHSWWLFTGLGVRGLLYHALMAEQLCAAVLADDDSRLDPVLRRWQTWR